MKYEDIEWLSLWLYEVLHYKEVIGMTNDDAIEQALKSCPPPIKEESK